MTGTENYEVQVDIRCVKTHNFCPCVFIHSMTRMFMSTRIFVVFYILCAQLIPLPPGI